MNQIAERYHALKREILNREFSRMNDMQKKAVFRINDPLLILAGAGSGKTTVLVNRIANMIRFGNAYESDTLPVGLSTRDLEEMQAFLDGDETIKNAIYNMIADRPVQPWKILAITFTNKAAGEMKQRLELMLKDSANDIWASTFHSCCAKILRRNADRLGFSNHFTVYDTDDCKRLMKDCQKALNLDDKLFPYRMILNEISRAKDQMISPEQYLDGAGTDYRLQAVAKAYKLFQRRLKDADAMDFDDLLYYTNVLLEQNPDVLDYYRNKFQYIMVDEYQDTNHAQYRFIQLLSEKSRNLCVVGDDDQSIYKFRGANIANILNFEETFPDATVIRLEQNYRSTQNIQNAANEVIKNNEGRKGKTLWTKNPAGDKVQVHTALTEGDEAKYIADTILDGIREGKKYSDFAILYRMSALSSSLEKAMFKAGIPYRIIGGFRFYERKEIRDMIAYLSVIANPSDSIRLRRIINEPKRSIGDKTVDAAEEIAASLGISLFETIQHADEYNALVRSASKLKVFTDMIEELVELSNDPDLTLHELYQAVLDKSDYINYLKSQNDESDTRIENVNELSSNIMKYEEEAGEEASLSGFLEEVSLYTDVDNYDADADSIVLMTMHAAKGLEFPVVFLAGMEEGIFPGYQAITNVEEEMEEERRLAYVGITRAKEKLYLLNTNTRTLFGKYNRNRPSRFTGEIPEEYIERSAAREWKPLQQGERQPSAAGSNRAADISASRSIGTGVGIVSGAKNGGSAKKTETYTIGEAVNHKVFGDGMILKATKMGGDTLLEIAFEKVGTKKVFASFANLKKL